MTTNNAGMVARMIADAARVLPPDARAMLVTASCVDPRAPAGLSKERTAAVNAAVERVKRNYPKFFR